MAGKKAGNASARVGRFKTFDDFYPAYLEAHSDRLNRRCHAIGTSCAVAAFAGITATQAWSLLWTVPVCGYGLAWFGHFAFEKNVPATFGHPLYSMRGDFKMLWQILRGKITA